MPAVRIDHLTRRHGRVTALDDLTLDIPDGAYVVILGPSGSGKTTLLRLVAGLDRPDAGTVWIDGRDTARVEPGDRDVAWVAQGGVLLPQLDVRRNIGLGLELRRVPRADRELRVREAARDLGLTPLLDRRPAELSAGERQRAALARALVGRHGVLLLDEPLANLDTHLRTRLRTDLRQLHNAVGQTVLHVTHDPAEALALGDLVLVLRDGRAEQYARPETLYHEPASAFIASFVGTPPINLVAGRIDDATRTFRPAHGHWQPLRPPCPPAPAGEVVLGLRPEAIRLPPDLAGTDVRLPASLAGSEFAGHEFHLTLDAAGVPLRARSPGRPPGPGSALEVGFAWADCRWFEGPSQRAATRPRTGP